MKRMVLFVRHTKDDDMEILPPNPTVQQIFDQMVKEFHEHDPSMCITMLVHVNSGDDVFACHVEHDGDQASLVARLQAAYDDVGVGGHFETAKFDAQVPA